MPLDLLGSRLPSKLLLTALKTHVKTRANTYPLYGRTCQVSDEAALTRIKEEEWEITEALKEKA